MEKQVSIHTDSQQLSGVLHIPDCNKDEKRPAIVICHGFISSKVGQHRLFVTLARNLCLAGYAVLRFDFSGCGESSGEYLDVTITQQIEEAARAIDSLEKHPEIDLTNITLLGHSLGGAIATSVAASDSRIQQLILLSPVANPFDDIVKIVGQERYQKCLEESSVNFEGFELGRTLFLSLAELRPLAEIHKFHKDVLLIHGSEDVETPLDNAYQYQKRLEQRAEGHSDLKIIKDADHCYCSAIWKKELSELILHWLKDHAAL
jgi:pimeloyl-ACP methyl ester carboxylesterase